MNRAPPPPDALIKDDDPDSEDGVPEGEHLGSLRPARPANVACCFQQSRYQFIISPFFAFCCFDLSCTYDHVDYLILHVLAAFSLLFNVLPFVGGIWFLILMVLDGSRGANRYGEDPKEGR